MLTRQEIKSKERGITLVVLVITIIVLLILAGVSISAIFGESGLINQAMNAKEKAKINEEKEIINISAIALLQRNPYEDISKRALQNELNEQVGTEIAKVVEDNNDIYVKIIESDRYYKVEDTGKIEGPVDVDIAKDAKPGDITTDSEGNELAGTEDNPYQINCIEDLCGFSNSVNSGTNYSQKYIIMTRNLNFKSYFSYINGTISVSGDIESGDSIEDLMQLLTNANNEGFIPIGKSGAPFSGNFNGKNHKIENLHENTTDKVSGLFGQLQGNTETMPTTIKNLTVTGKIFANNNVGGIVGAISLNYINFDNICNYIDISTTYGNAGGIIGEAKANTTINKCYNYGIITNTSSSNAMMMSTGGLIGSCYGKTHFITNCANYKKISGEDSYAYDGTGGIIGGCWGTNLSIYNTCNYADISGKRYAGGIIGSYTRISGIEEYI